MTDLKLFRPRVACVQAMRFDGSNYPALREWCPELMGPFYGQETGGFCVLGRLVMNCGDWLVRLNPNSPDAWQILSDAVFHDRFEFVDG